MGKKPYKLWNRNQLFAHLKAQLEYFDIADDDSIKLLEDAVYDEKWNPSEEFNGCNVVQDDMHPFFPCFIHDYRWITNQDAKSADYEFYYHLQQCNVSQFRATVYYFAVRLGWYGYFKWKK